MLDTRWLVFRLDVACAPAQWTHKLRSLILLRTREPVWPSGKLVSGRTSVRYRFGSPFSSKVVVCGHVLVTLSLTVNETLKWLSSLPILMQVILVVTV